MNFFAFNLTEAVLASDVSRRKVPTVALSLASPVLTCVLALLGLFLLAGPSATAQAPETQLLLDVTDAPVLQPPAEKTPVPPNDESTSPEPIEIQAPFSVPPAAVQPTIPAPFTKGVPPPPERWWIMRELQGTWLGAILDDNRLSFSGWTEVSYTTSTSQVSNLPVTFNDRANTFLLQQQWFRIDRALVTKGTTDPSFGYHLDVLTGSDYRWTLIRGLFNSQLDNSTGAQNLYGVDPIQFYANAYLPTLFRGTEIRVGRTYNPWGYESLEAVSTPMLSRSYAFFNTPFTLMGIGGYTTFSPEWAGIFILANGNDTYLVPEEEARFFGKLTYTAPNQSGTLQLGCTLGRGKFNAGAPFNPATVGLAQEPAGHNNFNAFDMVYTHVFNPVFTYVNETMFAWQTNVPSNVPGGIVNPSSNNPGTAYWASSCHYFRFTLAPRLNSILRVETFDDFDGQRTGFPGLYTAVTGGLQFYLRKDVIIRPELRYDYNGQSRPFEGSHDQFLAASDLIVRW
jgi:hypothetical protein